MKVNVVAEAIDRLANPARISDPDRLRGAVSGKKVLVTGHTGFKGSWLTLWLDSLGAEVHGLSLDPPTDPSLFAAARVGEHVEDIRGFIDDPRLPSEVRDNLRQSVADLEAKQVAQKLEIVACGTISSGKSSLLNALAGEDIFRTEMHAEEARHHVGKKMLDQLLLFRPSS